MTRGAASTKAGRWARVPALFLPLLAACSTVGYFEAPGDRSHQPEGTAAAPDGDDVLPAANDDADGTTDVDTVEPPHDDLTQGIFVAPDGAGDTCSETTPCSLVTGREHARRLYGALTRDLEIRLRGGVYLLDEPFELVDGVDGPHDSGSNGFSVIYEACAGEQPVLSGGRAVTGWQLHDAAREIWAAPVDAALETRQLYVNGRRATRARGPKNPPGFSVSATGYQTSDAAMAGWRNASDIEVVGLVQWKAYRCGIQSIVGNEITMKQPCWENARWAAPWVLGAPTWVENAYELLDEPGEWYLDRSSHVLYYKPRPGEVLPDAEVVAAVLETLVSGVGTPAAPLHDVVLRGLTFSHGTWLWPSTNEGYAAVQAGNHFYGSGPNKWDRQHQVPGLVRFAHAQAVSVEDGVFSHLGAIALDLGEGVVHARVQGNVFFDISGSAVQLGTAGASDGVPAASYSSDILVADNVMRDFAMEYLDNAGIIYRFGKNLRILHNDLANAPYSAISAGWGWAWATSSISSGNEVAYNLVADYMTTLVDGGGIYTLSRQRASRIHHNYLKNGGHDFGAIYLDEGSQDLEVSDNVVETSPAWLFIWTASIRDNWAHANFSNTASMRNDGTNNRIDGDNQVCAGTWPDAARAIIAGAGLEPAYVRLRDGF